MESIDCKTCFQFHDELLRLRGELTAAKKHHEDFRSQSQERESFCEQENEELHQDLKRTQLENQVLAGKLEAIER